MDIRKVLNLKLLILFFSLALLINSCANRPTSTSIRIPPGGLDTKPDKKPYPAYYPYKNSAFD